MLRSALSHRTLFVRSFGRERRLTSVHFSAYPPVSVRLGPSQFVSARLSSSRPVSVRLGRLRQLHGHSLGIAGADGVVIAERNTQDKGAQCNKGTTVHRYGVAFRKSKVALRMHGGKMQYFYHGKINTLSDTVFENRGFQQCHQSRSIMNVHTFYKIKQCS